MYIVFQRYFKEISCFQAVKRLFCFNRFFKKFTRSSKEVLRLIPGTFKEVSRAFLKQVSRRFQVCQIRLNGVSWKFKGCFQNASKMFPGGFKKMLRCFKEVSYCMSLIAATRAEGRLVSYL